MSWELKNAAAEWCTFSVRVIVVGNEIGDPGSNEAICNSLRSNTFGKAMNPLVLFTAMKG